MFDYHSTSTSYNLWNRLRLLITFVHWWSSSRKLLELQPRIHKILVWLVHLFMGLIPLCEPTCTWKNFKTSPLLHFLFSQYVGPYIKSQYEQGLSLKPGNSAIVFDAQSNSSHKIEEQSHCRQSLHDQIKQAKKYALVRRTYQVCRCAMHLGTSQYNRDMHNHSQLNKHKI